MCTAPHCNGADRGAIRPAALGLPVKRMNGGITGLLGEGLALAVDDAAGPLHAPWAAKGRT